MKVIDYTIKLLGLSEVIHDWYAALARIDTAKRRRVARYCDNIADTLARSATAFERLRREPGARTAARDARREFGRLAGYVEDIAATLEDHLDGRKIAGVKRRLEGLLDGRRMADAIAQADTARIVRLAEAEGYFRSLADRLRA